MMQATSGFVKDLPVVVVTSDEPWGHVWHTQLHFAHSLAAFFNVVFIGPPSKWSIRKLFSQQSSVISVSDTLKVMTYVNPVPSAIGHLSVLINDCINGLRISKMVGGNRIDLVWHFDRYRSVFFLRLGKVKHVYHVIDPVANLNYDHYLAKKADLVVSVSRRYIDHYLRLNPKVVYEGQGWDTSLPGKSSAVSLKHEQKPGSILLLGTFLDDVDYELLIKIVTEIKEVPMVLIGPDRITLSERRSLFSSLLNFPNVFWLGALPPIEYLQHVASSAVCLIAYEPTGKVFNRTRIFGTPLKVMSYLGCHKPVVSSIDCEIPELTGAAIYEVSNHSEFIVKVKSCIEGTSYYDAQRVDEYLAKMDYHKIIARVLDRLDLKPHG
jgi:hypothetical protein